MSRWTDPEAWARVLTPEGCVICRDGGPTHVIADLEVSWVTMGEETTGLPGSCALFFYVLQWIVAHLFAIGFSLIAGKSIAHLFAFPGTVPAPPDVGFGLGITYLAWILGIALTYPLCRWFAGVKRRRTEWWMSYL